MSIKEQMKRLVTEIKNEASAIEHECSDHNIVDNPYLIDIFKRVERISKKADKLENLLS